MRKLWKILCLICFLMAGVLTAENSVKASETGNLLIMSKPAEDVEIFSGAAKGKGKGSELTFIYSEHVGGTFDGACFTEGTYITLDYTGAENGVYIALVSSSGGSKWTAVYPSSAESIGENMWRQTYSYEDITKAWGSNFARLDIIQVYANVASDINVSRIAYVLGDGPLADTTDGTWDVPMEGIAFIGDSIVQNPIFSYGDWNTILNRTDCVNYGIGGQTTKELENRIDDVLKGDYEKIVFLCGINDIGRNRQPFVICAAYRDMLDAIGEKLPDAEVFIISVLPTTDAFFKDNQGSIQLLNSNLEFMTKEYDFATFVNVYPEFLAEDGYGKKEYYTDGLHPNEDGYAVIAEILNPYLDGTAENGDGAEVSTEAGNGEASGDVGEAAGPTAQMEAGYPVWQIVLLGVAAGICLVIIVVLVCKMVGRKKSK
ncbi:MAG: hypothetical protein IJ282_06350 [Lachnospiraceae bacterium]|nr:hypothetical protein [Lachnospiraceae bacterium]